MGVCHDGKKSFVANETLAMHPTNDPDLPSYQQAEYLEAAEEMELVMDLWNNLKGCFTKYIHQEQKEDSKHYRDRLARVRLDNRFKPAVNGYAGLLSEFALNDDLAPTIQAYAENIDGFGNNIHTFLNECDQMVLRDGWCGVFVDSSALSSSINSQADLLSSGNRPYLVAVDRRNIPNWDYEIVGGEIALNRVTIRELRQIPKGRYGFDIEPFYRVYYPDGFEVYQLKENGGKFKSILVDDGATNLGYIPLVYYSVCESSYFQASVPFINLAHLNIEHLQKRSQLNEVLRKCNLPVPVRKGLIRTVDDLKKAPPVVIGPNHALDIPAEGDFYFAEPSGSAIAQTKEDISNLEMAMDRVSLAFLTGGENNKTATEVLLNTAQTSANLKTMATRKESAIQQIFDYWVGYTGEEEGGTATIDSSILQLPITPEQINRLTELATSRFISQETLLHELKLGKALSRDFDIQREVQLTGGNSEEAED